MIRPALPSPVNGDFDIAMPDDGTDEPITSDFGRLEAPCPVATMEEQRRIAMDNAWQQYNKSGQRDRDEIDRAHRKELDAGLHNLHEPFEGLIR